MRVMLPLEHSGHTLMFYYTKGLAGYSPSKLRSTQTNVAQSHRAWERQLKDNQDRAAAQAFFRVKAFTAVNSEQVILAVDGRNHRPCKEQEFRLLPVVIIGVLMRYAAPALFVSLCTWIHHHNSRWSDAPVV